MGSAFQVYGSSGGNGFALMPPHFLCSGGNTTSPQDVAVSEEMICDCKTEATLRGVEAGTPELGLKHPSVLTKWNEPTNQYALPSGGHFLDILSITY